MKKNAMLKIAAILMVAVLLTTCAISSTFAKYTTSAQDTVTARVAKFGVTVKTSIAGLFDSTYVQDGYKDADVATLEKVVVNGQESTKLVNVVAPGTTKDIKVVGTIEGTPEVAVRVSYEATLDLQNWKDANGDEYCPLIFKVGDTEYSTKTVTVAQGGSKIDALETAVKGAIESYSKDYAPNTDLSDTKVVKSIAISWSWDFDETTDGIVDNDADTFLGDEAAAGRGATVTLTLTQKVEQIDFIGAKVESTPAQQG